MKNITDNIFWYNQFNHCSIYYLFMLVILQMLIYKNNQMNVSYERLKIKNEIGI